MNPLRNTIHTLRLRCRFSASPSSYASGARSLSILYRYGTSILHFPFSIFHFLTLQTNNIKPRFDLSTTHTHIPGGNGAYDFLQLAFIRPTLSDIITDPSDETPQNKFNALSPPYISNFKKITPIRKTIMRNREIAFDCLRGRRRRCRICDRR